MCSRMPFSYESVIHLFFEFVVGTDCDTSVTLICRWSIFCVVDKVLFHAAFQPQDIFRLQICIMQQKNKQTKKKSYNDNTVAAKMCTTKAVCLRAWNCSFWMEYNLSDKIPIFTRGFVYLWEHVCAFVFTFSFVDGSCFVLGVWVCLLLLLFFWGGDMYAHKLNIKCGWYKYRYVCLYCFSWYTVIWSCLIGDRYFLRIPNVWLCSRKQMVCEKVSSGVKFTCKHWFWGGGGGVWVCFFCFFLDTLTA